MEELENDVFEKDSDIVTVDTAKRRRETFPSMMHTSPFLGELNSANREDSEVGKTTGDDQFPKANGRAMPKSGNIVFRRSSTQIVIKEIPHRPKICTRPPSMSREDEEDDGDFVSPMNGVSWLFSGLYAMHIIIWSLVVCLTHYITQDISTATVDYYYTTLYVVASAWLMGFHALMTSCYRRPTDLEHVKSNHTTNRWLKCILVMFGLAIIIENIMELLEYFEYPDRDCNHIVSAIMPFTQAIFVLAQVNFLFRHSKVCLQDYKFIHRFGVMHVIATNLSVWILMVIIESVHAIDGTHGVSSHSDITDTSPHSYSSLAPCNISEYLPSIDIDRDVLAKLEDAISVHEFALATDESPTHESGDSSECECHTTFCQAVYTAQSFLYPFVIEFSLIASCMMYLVWRNIGRVPPPCEQVIKPSYKFFKSYKGFLCGNVVLIATIVVMVVLNTSGSQLPEAEKTYESEVDTLIIHNSFMVALELLMIGSCLFGVLLFRKDPRPMKSSTFAELDVVLLLVTIVGSITIDMFYILAVYASLAQTKYEIDWIWGAVYPILDIFQCVIQVAFVAFGLAREPTTSDESRETAEHMRRTFHTLPREFSNDPSNTANSIEPKEYIRQRLDTFRSEKGFINQAYNDKDHLEMVERNIELNKRMQATAQKIQPFEVSEPQNDTRLQISLPGLPERDREYTIISSSHSPGTESGSTGIDMAYSSESNQNFTLSNGNFTEQVENRKKDEDVDNESDEDQRIHGVLENNLNRSMNGNECESSCSSNDSTLKGINSIGRVSRIRDKNPQLTISVVAKTRVSEPNQVRLWIRDIVMFLLLANACLWAFLSLQSTAFHLHTYPQKYYSDYNSEGEQTIHTWTTITMTCLPLSIFFRMHSSACMFEIWSFS